MAVLTTNVVVVPFLGSVVCDSVSKRSLGYASEMQNYGMNAVTGIEFTFAGQCSLLILEF